jgi:hypothetical protein
MFVNKPSTLIVNTGIAPNNTVSGEKLPQSLLEYEKVPRERSLAACWEPLQ